MDIWDWALAVYARPGVSEACLALQDAHDQNVPLLLWAVWAEAADPDLLARAAQAAQAWDAAAVAPLRAVRRELKAPQRCIADAAREALREDVKGCELHAERILMTSLAGLGPRYGGAPALTALESASRAWGKPAPGEALAALAAALE